MKPMTFAFLLASFGTVAWSADHPLTVVFNSNTATVVKATPTEPSVTLRDDETNLALTVECQGTSDCALVEASLIPKNGGEIAQQLQGTGQKRTVLIPGATISSGFTLQFKYNKLKIADATVTIEKANAPAAKSATTPQSHLLEQLTYPCNYKASIPRYNLKGNVAEVVVTPLGQVLASNADAFDENDTLRVTVVVHPELAGRITVTRTSAFRDRTEVRILGEGVGAITLHVAEVVECVPVTVELTDFSPGKGEVRISYLDDKAAPTTIGSFELSVDPLFIGSFSAGPLWTDLVDPDIGVASDGTTSVIVAKADTSHDLRWGILFTPYIWGRRDVYKTPAWYHNQDLKYPYWHHINPTIGLPLDDIGDSALFGVTVDFPLGIQFTYGWHFGRVKELNPDSGLNLGDPFTGPENSLPLQTTTNHDNFIAVTLDMRVFVKLLKSIGGGGAK